MCSIWRAVCSKSWTKIITSGHSTTNKQHEVFFQIKTIKLEFKYWLQYLVILEIRYFWNLLGTLSLFTGEEKQFLHVYQHWNFSYLVRRWYSFFRINRDQRKLLISFSIANSMVFEFSHYYYYIYPIFGSNSKLDNQDNEFLSKNSHRIFIVQKWF